MLVLSVISIFILVLLLCNVLQVLLQKCQLIQNWMGVVSVICSQCGNLFMWLCLLNMKNICLISGKVRVIVIQKWWILLWQMISFLVFFCLCVLLLIILVEKLVLVIVVMIVVLLVVLVRCIWVCLVVKLILVWIFGCWLSIFFRCVEQVVQVIFLIENLIIWFLFLFI